MPEIIFDPDANDTCYTPRIMRGGALRNDIRCEYIDLCKKITSRDTTLDYVSIRNRILEIMKDDVISYIDTLPDEGQKTTLEMCYSGLDLNDTHFNCINIFALQITMLFTQYHEDKAELEKYHFFTYYDYNNFINDWKNYGILKSKIEESNEFQFLISSTLDKSKPIFMAFVGFLTIGELMESILNNVFFLGLSYELKYVDGSKANPISILWHDRFHYAEFEECYNYPIILKEFKEFNNYVSSKDKPTQYAINLTFFVLLHELPYCDRFDKVNSLNTSFFNSITEEFIYAQLEGNLNEFKTLTSQGMAIPKTYRKLRRNTNTELNVNKIKDYLHKVSEIYVSCYKEYKSTKVGGKRRATRKRKLY